MLVYVVLQSDVDGRNPYWSLCEHSKAYIPLQCITTCLKGLLWAIPPTRDFHAGCTCFKTTFSGQQVIITQNRISNALDQKQPHFV